MAKHRYTDADMAFLTDAEVATLEREDVDEVAMAEDADLERAEFPEKTAGTKMRGREEPSPYRGGDDDLGPAALREADQDALDDDDLGEDGDDEQTDEEAPADAGQQDDAGALGDASAGEAGATEQPPGEVAPRAEDPLPEPPPPFDDAALKEAQASLEKIRTEDDALMQRYIDGEISDEELNTERKDLRQRHEKALRDESVLSRDQEAHQRAVEKYQGDIQKAWDSAAIRFSKLGKVQEKLVQDPEEAEKFSIEIDVVAKKNPGMGFDELLQRAYRRMSAEDPQAYPPMALPGKKAGEKGKATAAKNSGKRDVPRSIRDVQEAAPADGKFSAMDSMTRSQRESALARMTPEEIDAWAMAEE